MGESIVNFQKGQRVKVNAVNFDRRAEMIGKTGSVKRTTKKFVIIILDDGGLWEALPENISVLDDSNRQQEGLFEN